MLYDTSNGGLEYQNQYEFDTLGHKKPWKSIKKPSDIIKIVLRKINMAAVME